MDLLSPEGCVGLRQGGVEACSRWGQCSLWLASSLFIFPTEGLLSDCEGLYHVRFII